MAQRAVAGPLGKGDLRHDLRLDPRRVAALRRADGERRVVAPQRLHALAERLQLLLVEARADLAGIAQLVAVVVAHEQRAERVAAALRRRVPADDELLLGRALPLQPVAGPLPLIGAVAALGDEALP